jgi:hypothetical protein
LKPVVFKADADAAGAVCQLYLKNRGVLDECA